MDWIKIPIDEILLSDRRDWQNYALIKFMALYCQLEREPSDNQLHRILNKKEFDFVKSEHQVVLNLIQSHIKAVRNKRHINKIQYEKKTSKNNAVSKIQKSERNLSDRADKIREDNNINIIINKLENILSNYHNRKFETKNWVDSIDKMLRIDKVPFDDVIKNLNWYSEHIGKKYVPIIESGKSLREKYTKLENAVKREKPTTEYIPQDWSWLDDRN